MTVGKFTKKADPLVQVSLSTAMSGSLLLPLQVVKAFPVSLSVIRLVGLESQLDSESIEKLRKTEEGLKRDVDIERILLARTSRELLQAFRSGFAMAAGYYIESGVIVWRALHHDYLKLLQLSNASSEAIDNEFFRNPKRLKKDTFVDAVAGTRVVGKVGEWVIKSEMGKAIAERVPPLDYLSNVVFVTFLTQCVLAQVTGEIEGARASNLRQLAKGLIDFARIAYNDAIQGRLHTSAQEEQHWYWSPDWQLGEVEADLDRCFKQTKHFESAEDLISDLRG